MRILALAILLTAGLLALTISLLPGDKTAQTAVSDAVSAAPEPTSVPEQVRQDVRNVTAPQMTQPPVLESTTIGRLPAAVPPPLPVRPPKPQPFARPEVVSAGFLQSGETLIELEGVTALAKDAVCSSEGRNWPCGAFARTAMQRFVRQRTVECTDPQGKAVDQGTAGKRARLKCSLSGRDLSAWLVEQGWAISANSGAFTREQETAKAAERGQWGKVPTN